ncbi:hypothetical protein MSAN_01525300 [Mycena sanguinolenta]|uniref:Protein kinase domain-containing protein n=1 Tax=Mycena sanguinolenta TaxID=230812 RepID=A0A8H7CZ00_9AGAR|nr:hypothetical protein MSAN_01525300 [Mycena sanguinolenta]
MSSDFGVYSSAFFPNASRFPVHGGNFTIKNVYNSFQEPAAFRTILLGDIKLGKEIHLNRQSGAVRQSWGATVRRVYSAENRRDSGPVTVAMYHGDAAKEEWRQHITQYEIARHPNIMQLYGLVSTTGLRAMVFHDELIPCSQFLRRFEHSPILCTYIMAYCGTAFDEGINYLSCVFRKPKPVNYNVLSAWVRPATGELCLDLVHGQPTIEQPWWRKKAPAFRLENILLDDPNAEAMVISNLDEDKYHELCSMPLMAEWRTFSVSTQQPIQGPTILRLDSKQRELFEIARAFDPSQEDELHWLNYGAQGEVLPNSWRRYLSLIILV